MYADLGTDTGPPRMLPFASVSAALIGVVALGSAAAAQTATDFDPPVGDPAILAADARLERCSTRVAIPKG